MTNNKQDIINFIINILKREIMELEFQRDSNNEQIKDFKQGIKEKQEQNELITKEIIVIKHSEKLIKETKLD